MNHHIEHQGHQQNDIFALDARAKETIKWSIVFNVIARAVDYVISYLGWSMAGGMFGRFARIANIFPVRDLISELIYAAIWGAVGGFILSKFWAQILDLNKNYLKNRLNTLFKILFYPTVVASLIVFLLGAGLSFAFGIMPFLFSILGMLLSRYIYAKGMVSKIEGQYKF